MADNEQSIQAGVGPPLYAMLPPAVRQFGLLIGIAAAVAAGVALVFWTQGPAMTPLYTGLADRDASEIVAVVEAAGVEYRLDAATGSILVPADRKYDLRMQLATAGLPRGAGFGIEQIPEMTSLGQTPFMENALYTRALETELARTIASVASVDFTRVHLALPPTSAFVRQRREPSASVLVSLFPGRRLERSQVQGIVNLVAAAVPELSPQRVTVTDQSGALLTSSEEDEASGLSNKQVEYRKEIEEGYARSIENMLAPVVGPERVRATVAAEIDFTVSEETRESFDPDVALVRSEQTSQESRTGETIAQGVPGALTNQPPAGPQTQPAQPAAPGAAVQEAVTPTSNSRSETRNFELDKTISHTRQATGTIERLSIGVLIDYRPASGGGTAEPLPQEELDSLTELAMRAVGFDEARGDTISVHNAAFLPPPDLDPPAPLPLWREPWVWDIARQALGALLVLALAFFIVRPIMRTLTRPQAALAGGELGALPPGGRTVPPIAQAGYALPVGYDDRIAAARSVAGQDPRQVAQVVKGWVAQDNG